VVFENGGGPDNIEPSPIGRTLPMQTSLHNRPIGEVVYELTGRTRDELLAGLAEQLRLMAGEFDAYDVHLVAAAVTRNADVICTANRAHLPEGPLIGSIEIIGPGRLAAELGIA